MALAALILALIACVCAVIDRDWRLGVLAAAVLLVVLAAFPDLHL